MAEPEKWVIISGSTYPVKDQIRALGGRWDSGARCWRVPEGRAEEARKLVAAVPGPPVISIKRPRIRPPRASGG